MKVAFEVINGYETLYYSPEDFTGISLRDNREVFDGQCEEIYAPLYLDQVQADNLSFFLLLLCAKLEHGGKLIVGGTEIIELTKNIFNYSLNHIQINDLIYSKSGLHSLNLVTDILLENNMQILKKQINGLNFLVEAVRP